MRKILLFLGFIFLCSQAHVYAESLMTKVTVIIASNQGNDFDLENDAYRDKLIALFSYTSYKQVNQYSIRLEEGKQQSLALADGYQLSMTLYKQAKDRNVLRVLIQKENRTHLSTELSLSGNGPVFLGGPPAHSGDLLLAIEPLA